jgi:hypothetical protein
MSIDKPPPPPPPPPPPDAPPDPVNNRIVDDGSRSATPPETAPATPAPGADEGGKVTEAVTPELPASEATHPSAKAETGPGGHDVGRKPEMSRVKKVVMTGVALVRVVAVGGLGDVANTSHRTPDQNTSATTDQNTKEVNTDVTHLAGRIDQEPHLGPREDPVVPPGEIQEVDDLPEGSDPPLPSGPKQKFPRPTSSRVKPKPQDRRPRRR